MFYESARDERGEYLIVRCKDGQTFTIDPADLPLLGEHEWRIYHMGPARVPYVARTVKSRFVFLHREIMQPAPFPEGIVDHRDGNGTNDRRYNMRLATLQQNNSNRQRRRPGKSGYRGVSETENGRFVALIKINDKLNYLGTFDDPVEAAKVYDVAAIAARGEFTALNFPEVAP